MDSSELCTNQTLTYSLRHVAQDAMVLSGPAMSEVDRFAVAEPMEAYITAFALLTWTPRRLIDPFAFVLAFTPEVWLLLAGTMLFLAALSAFIDRFLTPWETPSENYGFATYVWEFYRRLFPQGK